MNDWEKKAGTVPAATASTERKEVAVVRMLGGGTRQVRSTFHFDDVLTSFSNQNEVFSSTLEPLIGEVLAGFETTAFAYGQTGTGKTYTMEGDLESDEGRGMVPRAADSVFRELQRPEYLDYTVTVSYLEIYNEELCDLLAPQHAQPKLDLKDVGSGRGVCCMGLSEVRVAGVDDILKLVALAQERRRVAETRVNARSSRSHSIFTMKVRCRRMAVGGVGELENVGKLHLVDLAGSENAKKASQTFGDENGVPAGGGGRPAHSPEEERERRNINQSLLTLGRVIQALREGTGRVPYRDSKLTRLLQDALGGRCKTVIIATISPALAAVEETISTLTYAEQACGIKNRPVASSLFRTIRQAGNSSDPSAVSGGDYAELELKAAYLAQEVEEAQAALARQYREAQEAVAAQAAAEARLCEAEQELSKTRREADEHHFARHRLAGYAEAQNSSARSLSQALDASTAHGEDLSRRLAQRCADAAAVKKQARELCTEAEANSTALTEATKSQAKEVSSVISEVHAAHRQATGVAADITQEQQRIIGDLVKSLDTDAVEALLESKDAAKCLKGLLAEAKDVLAAAGAAAETALGEASAALTQAGGQAEGLQKAFVEHFASRRTLLAERCSQLATELASLREQLEADAARSAAALKEAEKSSGKEGQAFEARLDLEVRSPLEGLGTEGLAKAAEEAQKISDSLSALSTREACEEGPKTQSRWQDLLSKLSACTTDHEQLASTGGPQPALRTALEHLLKELETGSDATATSLGQCRQQLKEGHEVVQSSTSMGMKSITETLSTSDTKLTEAWDAQLTYLKTLDQQLLDAKALQEASNASQAVQRCTADASQELTSSMAGAVASLAAARERIASEVAALQERRLAEETAIELLKKQREGLQADVNGLQNRMVELGAELAKGEERLDELRNSQRAGRERALEAIIAAAKTELSAMDEDFEAGSKSLVERLHAASSHAQAASADASSAAGRSDAKGAEIQEVVASWSRAVADSCEAITKQQLDSEEATKAATSITSKAEDQFGRAGELAVAWGKSCELVSEHVSSAQGTAAELRAAEGELRSVWKNLKASADEVVGQWADGSRRASDSLQAAGGDAEKALEELRGSQEKVSSQHRAASEQAASWASAAASHGACLAELGVLGTEMQSQEAAAAELRIGAQGLGGLGEKAAEAKALATNNCDSAAKLLTGFTALTLGQDAAVRVGRQAAEAAMREAAAEAEALRGKVEISLAAATKVAGADLTAAVAETFEDLGSKLSNQAETLMTTAQTAAASSNLSKEAAAQGTQKALELAKSAEETRAKAVEVISKSSEVASSAVASTTKVGSEKILAELEKGGAAREKAAAAVASLAAVTASSLTRNQAALRQGLGGEPLAAFAETSEEEQLKGSFGLPPRPQAAERPDVDLSARPSDQDLATEFRNGGSTPPADSTIVTLPTKSQVEADIWVDDELREICAAAVLTKSVPKRKPSPAKKEAKAGHRAASRGPTPRAVLSEANRPAF